MKSKETKAKERIKGYEQVLDCADSWWNCTQIVLGGRNREPESKNSSIENKGKFSLRSIIQR